jgi:hypothetical protein
MHRPAKLLSENLKQEDHLRDTGESGDENIKMDLQETGCETVYWINLTQDRAKVRALAS